MRVRNPLRRGLHSRRCRIPVYFHVLLIHSLLPVPQAKDGADQDGRKSFTKRGPKAADATDFPSGTDAQTLDPISEEDEKLDHSSSSRMKEVRLSYHKLPSDEDSGPEDSDNTTPLLHKQTRDGAAQSSHRASPPTGLLPKPGFLPEILLDKKDSSDSGMRSSDSSSDRSLEEAEGDDKERETPKPSLIELELEGPVRKRGLLPSSLQDTTVARMSICSEAPSEASLMASSPDEVWPSSGVSNLNRTASNTTLNNNTSSPSDNNTNTNNSHQANLTHSTTPSSPSSSSGVFISPAVIITPGSSGGTANTAATIHHNQNLRTISLGDERESVL